MNCRWRSSRNASSGLANIHHQIGRALDLGADLERGDDLTKFPGHRSLQREDLDASVLEFDRAGIHLVVGHDHRLGRRQVLLQENRRALGNALDHSRRDAHEFLLDVVQFAVKGLACFFHDLPLSRNGR
jgi:hypothetical protein